MAEHVGGSVEGFANLMNQKAKELGLTNTKFVTPHGLDQPEHYTTAYELALITDYALKNETFAKIVNTKTYEIHINSQAKMLSNTNELLGNLNGVDGVKTGFTNGAGRCLVTSTTRNSHQIICVVLGADTKKIRTR
ncbi:MAG: D-alanyl-D-alanine carboxypeptidase [Clostridia bacterium]|nr:D-alanyl-D-alanine carboxypeptidase [Clostridia bacterium]